MEFFLLIGLIIGAYCLIGYYFGDSSTNSKKHTNSKGYRPGSFSSSHNRSSTSHYSPSNRTTHINTDHLRHEFNEMKTTDTFKKWKKAQYDCQNGKCAWCQCHLDLHSPYTQVDHLKPLCQGGTNEYNNFVLACKSCNYYYKKGNYTWRDRNGTVHNGWSKPSWIDSNPITGESNNSNFNNPEMFDPTSYDLSDVPF